MRQVVPVDTSDLTSSLDTNSITVWDFVWAVVIVAASFLLAALTRRVVLRGLKRFDGIPENYQQLIARSTGWFVIGFGIIYALVVLGVDLGPAVLALLLFAAIAFFAGRGLLENFAAGLVLQGTTMFEVGDQIETTAGRGTVLEITGRTVIILTPDGEEVNIPNATVVNDPLTNLTNEGARRSTVPVGVAYGTDLEEARRVIREAAASRELVLERPAVEALVDEFGDNAVIINCRFWHEPTILDENRAIDEVTRAVYMALGEHSIEIAFPQRTLWWGRGQQPGPG